MKTRKKWEFSEKYSESAAQCIAHETGLPLLPSRVLAARGVTDRESAERFLSKSPKTLFDPMLLPDMAQAHH